MSPRSLRDGARSHHRRYEGIKYHRSVLSISNSLECAARIRILPARRKTMHLMRYMLMRPVVQMTP